MFYVLRWEATMKKGPILNDTSYNFTTRDSLGIAGVATSISAELCSIVTTVTPRAFYWPFMVWIANDFCHNKKMVEKTEKEFYRYVKKQDYFFVMASLINHNDENNLVGKTKAKEDLEGPGPYPYNENYFKSQYGGMQYYNGGCVEMNYVDRENPETHQTYNVPHIYPIGEEMAKAFEEVIKESEYYKYYRDKDDPVPREVLKEYGNYINLGLQGFDKCKELLRHKLFETKKNDELRQCKDYIVYLYQNYHIHELKKETCRELFFDYETPDHVKITLPDELQKIARKWEIVIGRQYFTYSMELIWQYMLEELLEPMSLKQWKKHVIESSDLSFDNETKVSEFLDQCTLGFEEREAYCKGFHAVEDGLKVMLSIYNRFAENDEFKEYQYYMEYHIDEQSIPFTEFFQKVDEYKNKTVIEFLDFIMTEWIVKHHYYTALEKMIYGRDGFFYEEVDGIYSQKHGRFKAEFQGVRMIQLMQVMKDLDML